MIETISHKGLRLLWEKNDPSKLPAAQVDKIKRVLSTLDSITNIEPLKKIPGYKLHSLAGDLNGFWAVTITGNYRITFRLKDENVYDINYTDYH